MRLSLGKKLSIPMILVFFTVSLYLAACGKQEQVKPPVGGKTRETVKMPTSKDLIRELSADPQYLNPVLSNDYESMKVETLIFDSMLATDGSLEANFVRRLAERWMVSDDKKSITFFLRKGITWHDGEPFTAADVKFTFDTGMRDDVPAISMKSLLETINYIKIMDDFTIQFRFKAPYAPGLLYVGGRKIIPKHRLDEQGLQKETRERDLSEPVTFVTSEFSRKPIGTGPYTFVEWNTSQHVKLTRNDNYWDKQNLPAIEQVTFKIFTSRTTAFNVLQQGELDLYRARSIQYINFKRMKELHASYEGLKFFEPSTYYIAWNLRPDHTFFTNKLVRHAMTHALDRKAFIEKAEYGMGKIITGPFNYQSWAYNHDIQPLTYDLEKAFSLLEEAGWKDHNSDGILDKDGIKFEFEIMVPSGSQTFTKLALILQANLKKLSIDTSIGQYEWSVFLSRKRKGEFDAVVGGWSLGNDPDQFILWHSSMIDSGNNQVGYSNKEVDKLLVEGRQTFDRERRKDIYQQIHRLIHEDQPYTFVYCGMETYILSKRVQNVAITPYGIFNYFPGQLSWTLSDVIAP